LKVFDRLYTFSELTARRLLYIYRKQWQHSFTIEKRLTPALIKKIQSSLLLIDLFGKEFSKQALVASINQIH